MATVQTQAVANMNQPINKILQQFNPSEKSKTNEGTIRYLFERALLDMFF
jgi:hypothetical protein